MMAHPAGLPDSVACVPGWQWLTPAVEMAAAVSGNWTLAGGRRSAGWGTSPRLATRTPGADAGSIGTARDFTYAILRRWGITERREDIVVVVSELLSNAQRHALPHPGAVCPRWSIRLGLLQSGSSVLCAVSDPSIRVPALREPGVFEETGRGLHVVASLCDQWGYTAPGARGKVVWATFSTGVFWRPLWSAGGMAVGLPGRCGGQGVARKAANGVYLVGEDAALTPGSASIRRAVSSGVALKIPTPAYSLSSVTGQTMDSRPSARSEKLRRPCSRCLVITGDPSFSFN